MFRYNLKLALRNLFKNRIHSFINIFGLSSGIACFILISIFTYYEWNYDNFHKDPNRIYQILRVDLNPNGSIKGYSGFTPEPLTATLREEYSHYGTVIGLYNVLNSDFPIETDGEKYYGFNGVSVDPEFFSVFNFPLNAGNPDKCLTGIGDVVITQRAAKRYFGYRDPIGKIISYNKENFIVRGVAKDFPQNTVFKYDIFFSSIIRSKMSNQLDRAWWSSWASNFIRFNPGVSPDDFRNIFKELKKKHFPDWLMNVTGFDIQPLSQVHLNTNVERQIYPAINPKYLTILMAIAIAVLMIACINYVNLTTSRAGSRAKEMGIRKVAGAGRNQLMSQHFTESVAITLVAVFLSMILAELFLPSFNKLTDRNFELHFFKPGFLVAAIGFAILVGTLSGIYPGLVLSSFRPAMVLKNNMVGSRGKSNFRRSLVILQLTITFILVSTELLILKQINFMQTAPLGYDLDNILSISVMSLGNNQKERYEEAKLFEQAVSPYGAQYGFGEGSVSENIPGLLIQNSFRVTLPGSNEEITVQSIAIDTSFLHVFKIKLLSGSNFGIEDEHTYPVKVLVNETVVREMHLDSPLGQYIGGGPQNGMLIMGVIPDIHVESLQKPVEPLIFKCGEKNNFPEFLSYRLDPGKMSSAIGFLENKWKNLFPDRPFQYIFPKDIYLEHYAGEKRIAKILAVFVFLTIIISSLGIFGLILFNTQIRTREIGIRKAFGASVLSIIKLLSHELVLWVLIAFGIASYPAWYAMRHWLQQFAFKTSISWWVFGLSLGIILILALITAGWHTLRAARRNPVEVLRYE